LAKSLPFGLFVFVCILVIIIVVLFNALGSVYSSFEFSEVKTSLFVKLQLELQLLKDIIAKQNM